LGLRSRRWAALSSRTAWINRSGAERVPERRSP
jgi:hypothetical protein